MPVIKKPSEYFNIVNWTGNGTSSARSITGVGFQPDFVWSKPRSVAYQHNLYDVIRGSGKRLITNNSNEEATNAVYGYLSSFDSDGFSTSAGSTNNENWNETSATYVAWNWKESALAGFDIVTYTGNGGTGASSQYVNHNLGVTPNLIITKVRSSGATYPGWYVYLSAVQSGNFAYYGRLDSTDAWSNGSSPYQLWTANSTQIAFNETSNESGKNYVAYCFAEVAGYSKFGSYTGTGAGETNGPFIYCGFRPALIIIKVNANGYNWAMMDNERPGYNSISYRLFSDVSNEEYTSSGGGQQLDFLSNGFKLRDGNANYAGTVYYMAFAKAPFKYSSAR